MVPPGKTLSCALLYCLSSPRVMDRLVRELDGLKGEVGLLLGLFPDPHLFTSTCSLILMASFNLFPPYIHGSNPEAEDTK